MGRMRRARLAGKVPLAKAEPPAALGRAQSAELALFDEAREMGGGIAARGRGLREREDAVLARGPEAGQILKERAAQGGPAHLGANLLVLGRPGLPLRDELGFRHNSSSSLPSAMSFSAICSPKAIARCGAVSSNRSWVISRGSKRAMIRAMLCCSRARLGASPMSALRWRRRACVSVICSLTRARARSTQGSRR